MVDSAVIELYWKPGCSACLRMKEFVEGTGLPYEAINVDSDPDRGKKIRDLDLYLPVACKGDKCVNGQNLEAVAELIGVEYAKPLILEPAILMDRYRVFILALCRYLAQYPAGGLTMSLPGRQRPMLDVASQAGSVARAFLSAYHENVQDTKLYATPAHVATADDIIARARETLSMMEDWWGRYGVDDDLSRVVSTYWGYRTLLEILEREVWHTAHHTRQVLYALTLQGVEPNDPLTADDLAGLPLPARVHD